MPSGSLPILRVRKRKIKLVWPFTQSRKRKAEAADTDVSGSGQGAGDKGMSQDVIPQRSEGSTHDNATDKPDHDHAPVDNAPPPPVFADTVQFPDSPEMAPSQFIPESEPADPQVRDAVGLAPKSFADAAHEAVDKPLQKDNAVSDSNRDGTNGTVNGTNGTHDSDQVIPMSEPADPQVRDAKGLAPKSFADAAHEGIDKLQQNNNSISDSDSKGVNGTANGINGFDGSNGTNDVASDKEKKGKKKNVEPIETGRQTIPDHKSDGNEYEGTGLDNSPKSPTRGHKRKVSHKSNGVKERRSADKLNTELFLDYKGANGKPLTSVKPSSDLEKATTDKSLQPKEREALTAGRKAGEGWHSSKWVNKSPTAPSPSHDPEIRWAPLNVPLQRRLQTLAVLMHTLSIAGGLTIFFFLCSIPLLWPLLVPYLIYVLFSNAGVSGELYWRNERWRNSKVWSLFASYFPARLHRSQELEPTRKYIFGYHPHGIISHGAFAAFATEALGFKQLFPGITNTLLTLDSNFHIPLYREYALRMGLASVSSESITNILSKGGRNREGMGRAVTIVIGGARESLESNPGQLRLVLHRRKGFVKKAIQTGADLVPVLAFGENEIYEQVDAKSHPYIHKMQLLVKKIMGFTVPLFHARGIFNYDVGMMPYRRPMNVVTGRPIKVVQEEHPDNKTLDEIHQKYEEELMRIWNDYKDTFAKDRKGELEIIE